MNFYLI